MTTRSPALSSTGRDICCNPKEVTFEAGALMRSGGRDDEKCRAAAWAALERDSHGHAALS